jgi:YHS domain-containing protein
MTRPPARPLARSPARPTRRALCAGLLGAAILPAAFLPASRARAGEAPIFSDWRGRAIRGFDPVAYFTEKRPVEGASDITTDWRGATWRFASEENRARFLADPAAFAPQYGGYCAYAVAKGTTASIDPEAWRIVDGKLYLNYSPSVQLQWAADIPGHIAKADANFPGLIN